MTFNMEIVYPNDTYHPAATSSYIVHPLLPINYLLSLPFISHLERRLERERKKMSSPLLDFCNEEEKIGKKYCLGRLIDVEEAKVQLLLSVPMVLTNMSYYAVTLVSVMFAGHLGDLELAGATLGNSWGYVTGFALMTGLSGALETLCGQGYGAKLYRMLGIYLQSSIIISTLFSILVSILWFYSEPVLILLHQDPQVAKMAALYLRTLIPGLFAYAYIQCLVRFLQTQSVVIPLLVCSVITLVIDVGLTYLFVHVLGFGFVGASLATSVSLYISLFVLAIYVNYSEKFRYTWEGISVESLRHVLPSLKLALPSAVMVCLEYCAYEILVLLAGLMPNSQNSTSLVAMCVNTGAISFMITYGFSAAVSTRVSNEMGAGNVKKAKNAVVVTLKLSCLLALTVLLFLAFGHNIWAKSFTSNLVIVREFASMTPLLSLSILFDSAQGVLSGVARGCGWQHLAALANLVAFYLFGTPLALLFGFKLELHEKGLWMGLICGLAFQAIILLVITARSKWTRVELVEDEQYQIVV